MTRPQTRALAITLGVSFALLAPRAARAENKLEVTATPAKTEVTVGDDIDVQVTVKNAGDEVELTELTFDARSVSFELSVNGGKTAWDTQFHVSPQTTMQVPLKGVTRKRLKSGESWTDKFSIPAIAAGSWSVTAVYAGATPPLDSLNGINEKLQKQKAAPVTVTVKPAAGGEKQVVARINTTMGTLQFKFFPKDALGSAINFLRIARTGFYDGKTFHRVDKSLGVVQGGAPGPDGGGEFPYSIPRELGLKHEPLKVGMARGGDPNSGGSQFYICANSSPSVLDRPDGYAIFAEVSKGKDVVESLFSVDTMGGAGMEGQKPRKPLKIESVTLQLAP